MDSHRGQESQRRAERSVIRYEGMIIEQAVNRLMKEYGADEMFRPFFEQTVTDWIGDAKGVLEKDLEGIRDLLKSFR